MKKIIMVSIIIFLLTSPIIASKSINIYSTEPNQSLETTNIPYPIDPKINEIINKINETTLRKYMIDLLEISPRMTGTYGCEKAAEYIYNKFVDMGLETKYQQWASWGNKYNPKYFRAKNVEATIPGIDEDCDEIIIFNAHYDTVRKAPGANDDGSGTVAVLAAALILSQYTFNRTIKLVTFSGEEIGLRGSRAYAEAIYKNGTDILVEFNADMIGRATDAINGKRMGISITEDTYWIADIIDNFSDTYSFNFDINRHGIDRSGDGYSDYMPFAKYGYETVAFWQGCRDPFMHTPDDDLDNVNFSYLVNTTRHIVGTMAILADIVVEKPQIKIVNPQRGKLLNHDRTLKNLRFYNTVVFAQTLVTAEVKPGIYPIEKVKFYYDGKLVYTDDQGAPYIYWLNKPSFGKNHKIKAVAYDTMGNNATDELEFRFFNVLKADW